MSAARARLPRAVKGLSLVSLFNDFASEMVYPLLPAFVTGTLGAGAVALGALDGAADLTSAVVKWGSGRLADRPGWRRPLILAGYLTAVLVRPLISVTSAAWQVIGFRVIDRIGKGVRTPPRDALIAEVTKPDERGRAFGFHRGADHFGAVLGSVAAWWFLRVGADVRQVIEWSFVPGVVAFGVLAVVLRRRTGARAGSYEDRVGGAAQQGPGTPPTSTQSAPPPAPAAPLPNCDRASAGRPAASRPARPAVDATGRVFWGPVLALAGLTFTRLPETLLLLRLQDAGVAVAVVPLVWAALHVVRSAGSYPGGWLSDRIGPRRTEAGGGALYAAVAAVMGLALGAAAMAAVFLVFGLVAGLTESAERSLVARLAPVRTGRGFGAYHALIGFAALPAGIIFGEIYQRAGGRTAFWISAAASAVAVAAWLALSPRHQTETALV